MQGSIKERIRKNARDAQGKLRATLKVYDVYYRYMDTLTGKKKQAIMTCTPKVRQKKI